MMQNLARRQDEVDGKKRHTTLRIGAVEPGATPAAPLWPAGPQHPHVVRVRELRALGLTKEAAITAAANEAPIEYGDFMRQGITIVPAKTGGVEDAK